MRKALLALAALAVPASALVQPMKINFQGKLVDPSNNQPRNGAVNMSFSIYNVPSGGSAFYTEAHTGVQVANGVFSVQIGTNVALSRDLFLGASAYLGVTVTTGDGSEMTPRHQLVMSPYAVTASQLSDLNEVRLIAGPTYSTFTSAGNLIVPHGVVAATGTFTSVTATSGSFTGSGATQYSIVTASGIHVSSGTLDVHGSGGLKARYGVAATTVVFVPLVTEPSQPDEGTLYYNASSGTIKVSSGTSWQFMYPQTYQTSAWTVDSNAATSAKAAAGTILLTPIYISGPMVVNNMTLRVTTALGATGDVGLYNYAGQRVLNGGSGTVSTAAAVKTVAPAQTGVARHIPPGQYYAAVTWNSTTGVIAGLALTTAGQISRCGSVTGGGSVLPAAINPNAITDLAFCIFVGVEQ